MAGKKQKDKVFPTAVMCLCVTVMILSLVTTVISSVLFFGANEAEAMVTGVERSRLTGAWIVHCNVVDDPDTDSRIFYKDLPEYDIGDKITVKRDDFMGESVIVQARDVNNHFTVFLISSAASFFAIRRTARLKRTAA
ncbi:MAG: hypothetical protein J6F31_07735 [Oscillospiraceae bacterium]|nr:hypothetical protein [Oscillospiraceae bacterium]